MRVHPRPTAKRVQAVVGLAALVALLALVYAPAGGAVIVRSEGRILGYEPAPSSPGHSLAAPGSKGGKGEGEGKGKGEGEGKGEGKGGGKGGGSGKSTVEYRGGPVMPANTNYTLFWAPGGGAEYPAGFEQGIDGYFENLAHDSGRQSNSDSILAQYTDGSGHSAAYESHFGGALIDTDPYPPNGCTAAPKCLTDGQITAELLSYVQAHGLPTGLEHEYFVLTPEGVENCKDQAGEDCSYGAKSSKDYCAYHSFIEVSGADLIYAVNPLIPACDVAGNEWPNGNASDAVIAGGLAHEHSESLTDPLFNAWLTSGGEEVADVCQTFKSKGAKSEFGTPLGTTSSKAQFNEVINGHRYLYQQIWSRSAGECRQRVGEVATVASISPKTGPSSGGNTVTITGTNFVEGAGVTFGGAAASEVHVKSSTSLTAVAPAGKGKVTLTVTTPSAGVGVESKATYKYK